MGFVYPHKKQPWFYYIKSVAIMFICWYFDYHLYIYVFTTNMIIMV